MHDFLAGFNSPESVLADQNYLFSVFATDFEKREFFKFFPKTTLFHIYWYYIVNVSTMHSFLAGFNSPESVLADQNDSKTTHNMFVCPKNYVYYTLVLNCY